MAPEFDFGCIQSSRKFPRLMNTYRLFQKSSYRPIVRVFFLRGQGTTSQLTRPSHPRWEDSRARSPARVGSPESHRHRHRADFFGRIWMDHDISIKNANNDKRRNGMFDHDGNLLNFANLTMSSISMCIHDCDASPQFFGVLLIYCR